jgi:hypothetical protein
MTKPKKLSKETIAYGLVQGKTYRLKNHGPIKVAFIEYQPQDRWGREWITAIFQDTYGNYHSWPIVSTLDGTYNEELLNKISISG